MARPWRRGPVLSGPRPGLGNGLICCVQGPPDQQTQYCFDTGGGGCNLVWVSPPGIYPGLPQCVNGMHPSCVVAPPTPEQPLTQEQPADEQPVQPALVSEQAWYQEFPATPAEEVQVPTTPSVPVQPYTVPSVPTGAFPGEPFAPLAQQAPVQPIPVVSAPEPTAAEMPQPCPTGPIPLKDWAYGCAFSKAGLIPEAPAEAPVEGGGIPTAMLVGGGGLVAAGITAAILGLFG